MFSGKIIARRSQFLVRFSPFFDTFRTDFMDGMYNFLRVSRNDRQKIKNNKKKTFRLNFSSLYAIFMTVY